MQFNILAQMSRLVKCFSKKSAKHFQKSYKQGKNVKKINCKTRKAFAEVAKNFKYPMVWFKVYDTKSFDVDAWINSLTTAKLASYLEKY